MLICTNARFTAKYEPTEGQLWWNLKEWIIAHLTIIPAVQITYVTQWSMPLSRNFLIASCYQIPE